MRTHLQRVPARMPKASLEGQALSFAANELRAASAAIFTAAEDDRQDLNDPARRRYLKAAHLRVVRAATLIDEARN